MEIGLSVYDIDPVELVALGDAAEEAGFCTIWLGEHVVLPVDYRSRAPDDGDERQRAHRAKIIDPDTKLLDPLIAFGAVAAVTSRIRLATGIYLLPCAIRWRSPG